MWPPQLRDDIFKVGEKRWQKQPPLPEGTPELLSLEGMDAAQQQAAAAAAAAAQMARAMERERAMLAASNRQRAAESAEAGAGAGVGSGSAAEGDEILLERLQELELDPALAAAVQRLREMMSARTATSAAGASTAG